MSRKTPVKELLSEENVDSTAPIRRSSRISLSQNSIGSPAPKSVVTRRNSANSINEKTKPVDTDTSPLGGRERRKTRRTSTEEEMKPTPVKTRRSSISKIIEEEKKVSSSPNTPTKRINTRAVSTSPSNVDVPARRTRRSASASQEYEVIEEQLPVRRSTRRRPSVDAQEDASNEETMAKSKPTTRRRRSTSLDENEENSKNDVKQKTKRLYSEDNQLEPIEEHETEVTEKSKEEVAESSVERKKDQALSVIEESDDAEMEESNKIIKDIDDVLINKVSSPKPKSVEKIASRSIFSPVTPKTNKSEQKTEASDDVDTKNEDLQKTNVEYRPSKADSGRKLVINEIDPESTVKDDIGSDSKTTSSKNASPSKQLVVFLDKEVDMSDTKKGSDKENETEKTSKSPAGKTHGIGDKPYISMGSDDSFTLHLNRSLDKTQFPEEENDDVFTSPGSNKENSSTNIPRKSFSKKDLVGPKENNSNEVTVQNVELDVFASKKAPRNSFLEPMDVDCEMETLKESSKIGTPKVLHKESKVDSPGNAKHKKIDEQNQDNPKIFVQKATSSEDTEKTSISNEIPEKETVENRKTSNKSLSESTEKINVDENKTSHTPAEESEDNIRPQVFDVTCSSTISNTDAEKSFISLNSNLSEGDKMDSSFNMLKSPSKSSEKPNRSSNRSLKGDKNENENEDCMSSDISIRIVDSDEESQEVTEDKSAAEEEILPSRSSNRLRLSDGTSSRQSKQLTQMKKDDSISDVEASTNKSLKEHPETKEDTKGSPKKPKEQPTESVEDEIAAIHGSPRKQCGQPEPEEKEPTKDKNVKGRNSLVNSAGSSSATKDESKLDAKEIEFEEQSPRRKPPRQSLKKKPQEEDTSEDKSTRMESEKKLQKLEESDSGESMPELRVSENISTDELGDSEPGTFSSQKSSVEKYRRRQSLRNNSKKKEMNNEVEANQIDTKFINSGRKSRSRKSLNENFDDEETKDSNDKEKIKSVKTIDEKDESVKSKTNQKEMQELVNPPEIEPEIKESCSVKSKNDKDESEQIEKMTENSVSSNEEDPKPSISKVVKKHTDVEPLKTESKKSETNEETENMSFEDGDDEAENSNECSKSNKSSDGIDSETDNSNQKSTGVSKVENKIVKECDSTSKNSGSPLKSKMEKMKACGVNFVNPSPTASRIKLDEKTSAKIDHFLSEKFGNLKNEEEDIENDEDSVEDNSEDENETMSEDYESKSGFLDDMAEEGEEDTPSEGSNDIIDEGESINSTESEIDSDETYDSNDSFLVKDDADDLELLDGEEYDLEVREEFEEKKQSEMKKSPKRRRIIENQNTSSDEDLAVTSPRVSFSEKVEVICEKKSPAKPVGATASPRKISVKNNTDAVDENVPRDEKLPKQTFAKLQTKTSPRKAASFETPSIYVDLVDDSSNDIEEKEPNKKENSVREKSAFEERIRSLVEGEKSSTPNTSFNETSNTSRHNTSARSSSIIVHENVSINEIKDGFLAEKLQQVVNVFCAGIKTSDGNISMNVSLDYVENTPTASVSAKKDLDDDVAVPVADEQNLLETEETAGTKSRHSLNRSEANTIESMSRGENSRKRRSSNVFTKKEPSPKVNVVAEEIICPEDLSLLDASFDDENSVQDETKITDSGSSKKRRRSSLKKERRLSKIKNAELSSSSIKNDYTENTLKEEENKIANTPIRTEEIQHVGSSKKKRRSSFKNEKRLSDLNKNSEDKKKSLNEEEKSPIEKFEANSTNEDSFRKIVKDKQNYKSQASEEQDTNKSDYEQIMDVVKTEMVKNEENEQVKKKKRKRTNKKRKLAEESWNETLPELVTVKKMKLPEMKCEELSEDDLRHRLPSRNEMSSESNTTVKSKKLKRLQSKLKRDIKSTLLSGLVTDVKNRPRRLMKPSVQMNDEGWLIEEHLAKPSSANVTKCTFNFKKIEGNDFKNQMLYDPRIKREATSSFLRKKGYFI